MSQKRAKTTEKTRAEAKPQLSPNEVAGIIQHVLTEHNYQMFAALKVGNVEIPLGEIAGFPIVIKVNTK